MKIQWCGQACFLLTSEKGTRILTDPFNKHLGYPVPRYEVEGITVSHNHYDHNYVRAVPNGGEAAIIREPGRYQVGQVLIEGIAAFHDNLGGTERGINNIFLFQIDGLRIAHLGDLGHVLTPEQIERLRFLDVLLIPLGGTYTIGFQEANIILEQLKPGIAIPMHYKTATLRYQLDPLEPFIEGKENVEIIKSDRLELREKEISQRTKIIIFDCF